MDNENPFLLIDMTEVEILVKSKRSTIFKRVSEGNFPKPIGGTHRACWPQQQINDYIYQMYRFGSWSQERADAAFDKLNDGIYQHQQNLLATRNSRSQPTNNRQRIRAVEKI